MGHKADAPKERSAGIGGGAILEVYPAKIASQRTFIARQAPRDAGVPEVVAADETLQAGSGARIAEVLTELDGLVNGAVASTLR